MESKIELQVELNVLTSTSGCEKSLFREILLLWAENAELNFKAVCGFIRRDRRRACMGPKLTF